MGNSSAIMKVDTVKQPPAGTKGLSEMLSAGFRWGRCVGVRGEQEGTMNGERWTFQVSAPTQLQLPLGDGEMRGGATSHVLSNALSGIATVGFPKLASATGIQLQPFPS